MIILIYGEDNLRARRYLNKLISNFRTKHDPNNLNLSKIDGLETTFKNLSKEFSTIPFLAKKRMVVVENFFHKNKDLENKKEIIDYLLTTKDSIIVFFENESEKEMKKNEFAKILSKKQKDEIFIYHYPLLRGYEIKKWIQDEAKLLNIKIEPAATEILSRNIGNDLWKMSNELKKLAAYCFEKKIISHKDVQIFSSNKFEENIFALTDAFGNKDIKTSLKLFHEMMKQNKTKFEYILIMLIRQFRILLETKDFMQNKERKYAFPAQDDIVNKLKLHPFVASKSMTQAKKFKIEELKKIYEKILEFENKQKTGQIKPALMLDLLAVNSK